MISIFSLSIPNLCLSKQFTFGVHVGFMLVGSNYGVVVRVPCKRLNIGGREFDFRSQWISVYIQIFISGPVVSKNT